MAWVEYTVKLIEFNGMQHLVRDGKWVDELNHTYLPAKLPGNPRVGDRVRVLHRREAPYTRCEVRGQQYRRPAPGVPWVPVRQRKAIEGAGAGECEYCDRDSCLRGADPCDCSCHIRPNVASRAD